MTDDTDHTITAENRTDIRLELRGASSPSAALDGAWWPRTRNSAHELAVLIEALDADHAHVRLIMLNPQGWNGRPRRIDLHDHSVRVEWITMLDRSVVICATAGGRRLDVQLVVSADLDGHDAAGDPTQPVPAV
jgi:Family of unknown function (DUF5994)